MKAGKISVIMGIYNCEDTLEEAINSIISQTYENWELIMCDDGSTDGTFQIAKRYADMFPLKVKLIQHEKNQGLNITLNDCLKMATGEYIGRMDGDDISLPNRFEKELAAFTLEPELAVVSCPMIYFDENGEWGRGREIENYPAKRDLARGTVHCHAAAIIRAEVMKEVGGYTVSNDFLRVEDWNLWIKIYAAGFYGKNLGECLYKMRDDREALKRKNFSTSIREAKLTFYAVHELNLPKYFVFWSIRPILVGILPKNVYSMLHRWKLRNTIKQ